MSEHCCPSCCDTLRQRRPEASCSQSHIQLTPPRPCAASSVPYCWLLTCWLLLHPNLALGCGAGSAGFPLLAPPDPRLLCHCLQLWSTDFRAQGCLNSVSLSCTSYRAGGVALFHWLPSLLLWSLTLSLEVLDSHCCTRRNQNKRKTPGGLSGVRAASGSLPVCVPYDLVNDLISMGSNMSTRISSFPLFQCCCGATDYAQYVIHGRVILRGEGNLSLHTGCRGRLRKCRQERFGG